MIVTHDSASPIDYLLIGHMTADLTPNGRTVGGTVSYAIRTAHAFGLRVGLVTSTKVDEPLLNELAPYGQIISVPASATMIAGIQICLSRSITRPTLHAAF